jgi:fructose/tagatose bisphosphate aldolase
LPQGEVLQAIELGVAKLNVNTELRQALKAAVLATAADPPASDAVGAVLGPIIAATEAAAAEKLSAFTALADLGAAR